MSKTENQIALEQVRQELERLDEQLKQINAEYCTLNQLKRKLERTIQQEPVYQT